MRKVAVLTSGGDSPGMNAAIRAIVNRAHMYSIDIIGVKYGFQGLIEKNFTVLTTQEVEELSSKGGTILKSSRFEEFKNKEIQEMALQNLYEVGIQDLIVIGGNGSIEGAKKLLALGLNVIVIPGTIDNDVAHTEYTIGFDTTLNTILDCINKLKDTNTSHDRTTIVEVMGRNCGDLAHYTSIAGEGEIVSTPETPLSFIEIAYFLKERIDGGKLNNTILITEKMVDIKELQDYLKKVLQVEVRTTVLGFLQRGGRPSAFDRILAARMSSKAVDLINNGINGQAIGIDNNQIIGIPLNDLDTSSQDQNAIREKHMGIKD